MKLALKEMKFYKFKYLLILLIVVLLSSMVLFITGLAKGLARENISMIDNIKTEQFVIQDNQKPQLEKSMLTKTQQDDIASITSASAVKLMPQTITNKKEDIDFLVTNQVDVHAPQMASGEKPKAKDEIALNNKMSAEDIHIGDRIELKGSKETFKVTGFIQDTMYSHSSVGILTNKGLDTLKEQPVATFFPVSDLSKTQKSQLDDVSDVTVVSQQDITDEIPSYQAEQMPLNMMIVSLFVITAIVLSAFFYVMTIQKISQIGILKAVGIRTRHLLSSLVSQIVMTTLLGTLISIAIIGGLSTVMPVAMPFYMTISMMLFVVAVFLVVALIGAVLSFIKIAKVDPLAAIGGNE